MQRPTVELPPREFVNDRLRAAVDIHFARLAAQLHNRPARGDNLVWSLPLQRTTLIHLDNPFQPGAMVLLTLGNPREKFWGAILALTAEGLSLSGIELGSFEDTLSIIKAGDPASFGVVFFPMHRIERVELDSSDVNVPSLSQRFAAKTGLDPVSVLTRNLTGGPGSGGDGK